tara:strand:+ start:1501 stop:1959 length:459 start_codon:yes stop_codon:yes gene_type:complete
MSSSPVVRHNVVIREQFARHQVFGIEKVLQQMNERLQEGQRSSSTYDYLDDSVMDGLVHQLDKLNMQRDALTKEHGIAYQAEWKSDARALLTRYQNELRTILAQREDEQDNARLNKLNERVRALRKAHGAESQAQAAAQPPSTQFRVSLRLQ